MLTAVVAATLSDSLQRAVVLPVDSLAHLVRDRSWRDDIVLGVVAGLVTSIVVFLLTVVWQDAVRPKLEEIAYKGVDISGKWTLVDPDGGEMEWQQVETMEIVQKAHRIRGSVTLAPREGRQYPLRTLKLEGEVCDRFVYARMTSPSKQQVAHVTFLAEVTGDGNRLNGQTAFYNIETSEIDGGSMSYWRGSPGRSIGPEAVLPPESGALDGRRSPVHADLRTNGGL